MRPELNDYEEKMKKTLKVLASDLDGVRAGRATPVILDKIRVDYYGTPTAINALGTVSVPEPRILLIQPWDKTVLKEIEKAIQASDIGINPQNDGTALRLAFPPLTEERRKELVKQVAKKGEDGKVAIRAIRREAIEKFKAQQKKSEMTEDDLKQLEQETQKLHDQYIKEVDATVAKKDKEIVEI